MRRGQGAPGHGELGWQQALVAQALGLLHGLRAAGVRVPEDVAVVGLDGIEEAAYAAPPLTTAHRPVAAMAEAALDALERPGGPVEGRQVLGLDLVVRQSCGCPAPRP